ncbi:MAG: molybdopterin molybdotransferase MoeA [bacterium]
MPDSAGAGTGTPKWLTVDEALLRLEAAVPEHRPAIETIPVDEAAGRTLTESPTSRINIPPADNSAMDGFAVRLADVKPGGPLPVSQRIPAGVAPQPLQPGTAARIFTGAEIPPAADTVVMQENCSYDESTVTINQIGGIGDNIRKAGGDIRQGETLLQAGRYILSQDIGLLAAAGIAELNVFKRLKVSIIATGDELVKPGNPLPPGKIYESNAPMIAALLRGWGFEARSHHCPDDLQATQQLIDAATLEADLVITIGGVSVGEEDHVKTALAEKGELDFWKIGIKPGKPFAFGTVNDKPLLGLPGNTVSSWVTCALFCKPFARKLQGGEFCHPKTIAARAKFSIQKPYARQQYIRVVCDRENGVWFASQFRTQSSSVITSLSRSDGLAVVPPDTVLEEGESVQVIPFSELMAAF